MNIEVSNNVFGELENSISKLSSEASGIYLFELLKIQEKYTIKIVADYSHVLKYIFK